MIIKIDDLTRQQFASLSAFLSSAENTIGNVRSVKIEGGSGGHICTGRDKVLRVCSLKSSKSVDSGEDTTQSVVIEISTIYHDHGRQTGVPILDKKVPFTLIRDLFASIEMFNHEPVS